MCRWVWTVVFLYLSAFPQAVRRMCRHGQKNRATRGATRGATTHHSAAKAKVEKPTSVISGVLKPGYTTKNWFLAVCVHRRLPVSLSVVFFPLLPPALPLLGSVWPCFFSLLLHQSLYPIIACVLLWSSFSGRKWKLAGYIIQHPTLHNLPVFMWR